jgi:hypothetical protein
MDEADLGRLASLSPPIAMPTAELRPTLLYCKNRNVDHINDTAGQNRLAHRRVSGPDSFEEERKK